jgi:hypothetical protein
VSPAAAGMLGREGAGADQGKPVRARIVTRAGVNDKQDAL